MESAWSIGFPIKPEAIQGFSEPGQVICANCPAEHIQILFIIELRKCCEGQAALTVKNRTIQVQHMNPVRTITFPILFLLTTLFFDGCHMDRNGKKSARKIVTDIDGNIYQTVKIGKQVWMAENLAVTHYNDGTPIPEVTDAATWYGLESPGYCWYNNDSARFGKVFGALYNYHTIESEKLCPEGWRVPDAEDFRILLSNLDPSADFVKHEVSRIAGGKMKSPDTLLWTQPNVEATNASGFSALPGGCRSYAGNFSMAGSFGYYGAADNTTSLALRAATGSVFMRDKVSGYVGVSVRCLKEESTWNR
jgi:uncharacterized protein (TIGR02145 family)